MLAASPSGVLLIRLPIDSAVRGRRGGTTGTRKVAVTSENAFSDAGQHEGDRSLKVATRVRIPLGLLLTVNDDDRCNMVCGGPSPSTSDVSARKASGEESTLFRARPVLNPGAANDTRPSNRCDHEERESHERHRDRQRQRNG